MHNTKPRASRIFKTLRGNISQRDFSRMIGVNTSHISSFEAGYVNTDIHVFRKYAEQGEIVLAGLQTQLADLDGEKPTLIETLRFWRGPLSEAGLGRLCSSSKQDVIRVEAGIDTPDDDMLKAYMAAREMQKTSIRAKIFRVEVAIDAVKQLYDLEISNVPMSSTVE